MDNIDERLRQVISACTMDRMRYVQLEKITGISAELWKNFWMRRKKPDAEMIQEVSRAWPQYAFWLTTGITDPDYGHVAPAPSPGWTVLMGKPQEHTTKEFLYLIAKRREEPTDPETLNAQRIAIAQAVERQRENNQLRATYFNFERAMKGYGEPGRSEFYATEADPELRKIRRNRYEEVKASEETAMQWRRYVYQNLKFQDAMNKAAEVLRTITNRLKPGHGN